MNWDISLHDLYFVISAQRYKSYDGVYIYTEASYYVHGTLVENKTIAWREAQFETRVLLQLLSPKLSKSYKSTI